jgi:CheY-like chemotaxis protein
MMGKTVLICDDDESIVEILSLVLTNYGFKVIPERNSTNVFSSVDKNKPDILLLDLWMPVLPGDEVIRNLKSNPATSTIPVILISASSEAQKVAVATGADAFLAKPFQLDELIGAIENVLAAA